MGDFNSGPKDPIHSFLKSMQLPPSLEGASKDTKAKIAEIQEYKWQHAYGNYKNTKTEPAYSSYKPTWNGSLSIGRIRFFFRTRFGMG
jgi:hypothetical protein